MNALTALAGADEAGPDSVVDKACLRRVLTSVLLTLPPREERVVRLRFLAEQSLDEVAAALDTTRERARVLEVNALRRLKLRSRSRSLLPFIGADASPKRRTDEPWSARGLPVKAALLDQAAPTWARFRLLAAHAKDAPTGLANIVAKLHGRWSKDDFGRLSALLSEGGAGAKVLRHAASIAPDLTLVLAALPHPLRETRIARLLDPRQAALVAQAAARIGANTRCDIMGRLRKRLGRAQTTPRLFQMLVEEAGGRLAATAPDLATSWLRPLDSARQLERAALTFRNCLRTHLPRLLTGDALYFEANGPSPAIVQIVRDGAGGWSLGELAGMANRAVTPALYARLHAHLRAHQVGSFRAERDNLAVLLLREAMNVVCPPEG